MDKLKNQCDPEMFAKVVALIDQARKYVGRTADLTMCVTYFEIGRMIVEEEQGGKQRAAYAKGLLPALSRYLSNHVGKGFSETTLKNARKFYLAYGTPIRQAMLAEFKNDTEVPVVQALSANMYPFTLSWSHYLVLMRIKNEDERRFYEIEATNQQWTYRYLARQYGSSLYERLALSRDKDAVLKLAEEGHHVESPRDLLKNPLVLDFLDMHESASYSEKDLETAVISKLQQFLLELGKGFLFEARQKRFTFNEKHYKVDLVTYNRLLKCYVLIDFKADTLEHQDLGQMMMYVHYYDRFVKMPDENPTVGILLCKEKDDAIVKLTLPQGENIYASEYNLYLPDKTLLQSKLAEWIEEFEDARNLDEIVNMK